VGCAGNFAVSYCAIIGLVDQWWVRRPTNGRFTSKSLFGGLLAAKKSGFSTRTRYQPGNPVSVANGANVGSHCKNGGSSALAT
jgi:hypothetical protein